MREELEPAIFKTNEYRHWKAEQSGAIFPFSIPTQELPPVSPFHERRVCRLEEQASVVWEKAVNRPWKTEKAKVVEVLDFFPQNKVIPQIVVNAYDQKALEEAMFSLFKPVETWLGVRTCYWPDRMGKTVNIMGLKAEGQIRKFLKEIYPTWLKTEEWGEKGEHLKEAIVLGNPPLLGSETYKDRHFVFMTSVLPHQFLTEVKLNTSQLRSLEKEVDIEITSAIPNFRLTTPRLIFREFCWKEETVEKVQTSVIQAVTELQKTFNVLAKLKGLSGQELVRSNFQELSKKEPSWEWPEGEEQEKSKNEIEDQKERYLQVISKQKDISEDIKAIASGIFDPGYFMISTEMLPHTIRGKIYEAVRNEKFDRKTHEALILSRALVAAEDLESLIFNNWLKPPMDLYYRLVALNKACILPGQTPGRGYDTIEVQGAYNQEGKIEYALIYALRAREEKEFGERAKTQVR